MSQLDRKTGLKHLRVRGLAAVSFCATLKAAGINILRAVAFKNSENGENSAQKQRNLGLFDLIYVFKERFSYGISTFVVKIEHSFGLDSPNFNKTRCLTFYETIIFDRRNLWV